VRRLARLPAIATTRLRIRALEPPDAAALRAISGHPSVIRAIHFLRAPMTRGAADALIRGEIHGVDRFYGVRRDGRLIGVVGLGRHGEALEVGYWFDPEFQGRGHAQEAVGAVLARVRRRFPSRAIVAECHPRNRRSWRLLKRLGFHPDGTGTRPGRDLLTCDPALGCRA
jgi:RimJ/RimL family protein N-acetyltransferase